MNRRFQFSVKTMLWLTLVVAAFFGGAVWQRSTCEILEMDVEALREDVAAQSEEMNRLEERVRWLRRQLAIRDPKFDVPDEDARRAPSAGRLAP